MNGVLLLNKPAGFTSHDCVMKTRKLFKTKKVGHTGTLDPDVTGVLPICIGRATKIVEFLTASSKTYEAEVTIGFSTTTEDASGEIVDVKKPVRKISRNEINDIFSTMMGEIEQVPPMYSAIKVKGKKLYEYARQGIEVERPKRTITIYELTILDEIVQSEEFAKFRFRVTCSKGTYVRTLAVMIGERLGYPAHMSHLIRTKSGSFDISQCLSFEEVETLINENRIENVLIPIGEALNNLPKLVINDTLAEKVKNGAVLPLHEFMQDIDQNFVIYDERNVCLAIYQKHPQKTGLMKPVKVLQIAEV